MQKSGETRKSGQSRLEKRMLEHRGYLCRGLLGEGAFSRVYWVEAAFGGASYACKISENGVLLEREAQIMALLQHPLFPEYYAFWKECGKGFLLREYVPGRSLEEMLGRRGCFSAERTISMGLELTEGLRYLHERQEHFLFRDIKPANIILRQDGRLKLIDLGCVCSLNERVSSCAGSPGYAAPEQLQRGGILTQASDIYGLGQTLKAVLGKNRDGLTGKNKNGLSGKDKNRLFGKDKNRLSGKNRDGLLGKEGLRPPGNLRFMKKGSAGRSTRKQKALEAGLLRVLDACTREEGVERIPDMKSLERELQKLLSLY